jgi:HNH endonuclease
MKIYGSPSKRFWARVLRDEETGCWIWMGKISKDPRGYDPGGYGLFGIDANTTVQAHRFAYQELIGPIPDGLVIDHLCHVRLCVNPSHLEPVTQAENNRRSTRWQTKPPLVTHCKYGHEYTPENTYTPSSGKRQCRTCKTDATRRFNARLRAK